MGRPIQWTEAKIAEMISKGYGQGTGASYRPWIEVQMLSSLGVSHRPQSLKTRRHHHLLSDIELYVFLALEWQQDVLDIREQYPLDRDLTRTAADKLKLKHPCYPGTRVPTVMTVDFLATKVLAGGEQLVAFNAKPTSEAEDSRSLSKLEIQRASLSLLGIPHHLVFDTDIPEPNLKNLRWINGSLLKVNEKEPYPGYWQSMTQLMENVLAREMQKSTSLGAACKKFDIDTGEPAGTGIRAVRMLMASHVLVPDLRSPDLLTVPLMNFHLTGSKRNLRSVGGQK